LVSREEEIIANLRKWKLALLVGGLLATSTAVLSQSGDRAQKSDWEEIRAVLTNARSESATVRLEIGPASNWQVRPVRGLELKDRNQVITAKVKPDGTAELRFWLRYTD
jgi:hypothetical protein